MTAGADSRRFRPFLLFVLFLLALFATHFPLLQLPYFWDEAGYYIPAARDVLLSGSLIPRSTISNAHPPLVMAYLALAWKIFGYSILVTRTAMLAVAAFSLVGVFRLAETVANTEVAIASAICTALYPVFFAQSSLAHIDLAAAGLTFWGLRSHVDAKKWSAAVWFSLAVLAKETAILAPLAVLAHDLARVRTSKRESLRLDATLLFPLLPLVFWYWFHYQHTGFVFGNPGYFRYNVQATLQPLRILLALGLRLWQVLVYMNLFLLTLAALFAMGRAPLSDRGIERNRIAPSIQFSFLAVIAAYVVAMSCVGGAVLARYMLPAMPLVIIICISTLRRRVQLWRCVVTIIAVAFIVGLFINPPYGFAMEDNLAYRDYILLHQRAEEFLQQRYPSARVLTAWPASDELTRPYLGYVRRPMQIVAIEDFTIEQLESADMLGSSFDVALVFSTKYDAPASWFTRWHRWQEWKMRFFGYHRDAPPLVAARILGGRLVFSDWRNGQWISVIEIERAELAAAPRR